MECDKAHAPCCISRKTMHGHFSHHVRSVFNICRFSKGRIGSSRIVVIAAKHHVASVAGFVGVETAFTTLQYVVVSPMIALAYSYRRG